MSKTTGILLSNNDGDVQVNNEHLAIGNVTYQNQRAILLAQRGELKELPAKGVGIADMIEEHEFDYWRSRITKEMESEGMRVNKLTLSSDELIIDAEYK